MIQSKSLSKTFIYSLFALVLINLHLAVTLLILQGTMNYTGFDETKITVTSCNSQIYKTIKFLAIYYMLKISFIMTIIATACILTIFIVFLIWVIRVCKIKQGQNVSTLIERNTKNFLYIIGSINIIASVPIFGYYLTFLIQIPNCDVYYYDSSQLRAIAIISGIFTFISLILLIFFLYILFKDFPQQKYKQIQYLTYLTEPGEKAQQTNYKHENNYNQPTSAYKNQRNSPSPAPLPPKVYTYQPDKTKENLYDQPTKKAIAVNQTKQPNKQANNQPQIQQNKYKSPIQKYVYEKNPQPKPYNYSSPNYKIPQTSNKLSPQKPGELVYAKNRSHLHKQDHDSFKNEEQRYLSKYGGPILPSSGVSEVQHKQKKKDNDYFNSPIKRNNQFENSPNHGAREGVLAKYIRGKYAN